MGVEERRSCHFSREPSARAAVADPEGSAYLQGRMPNDKRLADSDR